MSTSLATLPIIDQQARCCDVCPYNPDRVRSLLTRIAALRASGYEPCEAMASVMSDPDFHGSGFGPGMKRGLDDVADIARAIKAGHRDPVSVARFLCPFAVSD